jgi:hypothetical protein
MRLFYAIKAAVQMMPAGLRTATFLCALFSIFAPVSLLPFGTYAVDGVPVSLAEFWQRGGGPIYFGFGVGSALLVYGFLRARRWSRPLFVIAILSLALPAVWFESAAWGEAIAASAALSALVFWYIYHRRTVREYFSRVHDDAA